MNTRIFSTTVWKKLRCVFGQMFFLDGGTFARTISRFGPVMVVLLILFSQGMSVEAACGLGRQVIVGQLPDVFFEPGLTAVKTITYTYKNVGGGWNDCGIYAQSTIPGVAVINSYGSQGHEAFSPAVTGIGPATFVGAVKTWSFKVKALASAPAGSGVINIYVNEACDVCSPNYVLIGKVNVYVSSQTYATTFVATANISPFGNTTGHTLYISHLATSGNPAARLIVTSNWNPGGTGGIYNNHPIGVLYDGRTTRKWGIYNEDSGQMSNGTSFNIRIAGPASFNHQSTPYNIASNWTIIDHPITNGNPNAMVFVTHNYSAGGVGLRHSHNLGVWYNGTRWAIFNQDGTRMSSPVNFTVHVLGLAGGPGAFIHTASTLNTTLNCTWIDNPITNGNPNVTILVTPNFNPGGTGGTYVRPAIGVYYDHSRAKWAIFGQDRLPMPYGASFNVLVPVAPI